MDWSNIQLVSKDGRKKYVGKLGGRSVMEGTRHFPVGFLPTGRMTTELSIDAVDGSDIPTGEYQVFLENGAAIWFSKTGTKSTGYKWQIIPGPG